MPPAAAQSTFPASPKNAPLTGPQKAALVILGMDESVATEILRHLDEKDMRKLAAEVDAMKVIPVDKLDAVFGELVAKMKEPQFPRSGGDYLRRLAVAAHGPEQARRALEPSKTLAPFDQINNARVDALAELLMEEHAQIAAVILSQLSRERAAEVLLEMPTERQKDLLARLAGLEEIPAQALATASEALVRALGGAAVSDTESENFDGVAFAAAMLNEMTPADADRLLGEIEPLDAKLGPKIREAMFTFDDLGRLEKRAVQTLMRDVPGETLVLALKQASDELREHFLGAISQRAAAQLREDLEMMPPTRISDVEKAQREIVDIAMRLSGEGRLVLPTRGKEEMV
jgi:flagellar motor switch protein FliG